MEKYPELYCPFSLAYCKLIVSQPINLATYVSAYYTIDIVFGCKILNNFCNLALFLTCNK